MPIDVLIRNGRVIDPAAGLDAYRDVAISGDRVTAVEAHIPADAAAEVIDATGRIVTPGLIDMHSHVYRGHDFFGVDADAIATTTGVTTWVDAGSAGAFGLPGFREFIVAPARVRIRAFLNISYLGLAGLNYDEHCNPAACDVDLATRSVAAAPDVVVGIKTRMGSGGVCGGSLEPLHRAVRAAEIAGLPVMCHISDDPPPIEDVLALLRPGDLVTHCYTGGSERLIDDAGRPREAVLRARERGVLFDVGHGAGSFSFASAEALAAAGFWPDTISTDLHQASLPGPDLVSGSGPLVRVRRDGAAQLTLPLVMTKLLALGLPLSDVIRAVTAQPAQRLGMAGEIGTLKPGAIADIAILELVMGQIELFDIHHERRAFDRSLRCHATLVAGRLLAPQPLPPPPPWVERADDES